MLDIDGNHMSAKLTVFGVAGLMSLLGGICYIGKTHMGRLGLTGSRLLRSDSDQNHGQNNQGLQVNGHLSTAIAS